MTAELDFTGRVAIVTGAGQGIGRAYAELLASRGASVVVNDLGVATGGGGFDDSRSRAAAAEIVAAGGIAVPDASDISTEAGAQALVDRAIDTFGRLDIVINNAGIFALDRFPDIDVDLLQRMFDVHIKGAFNVTRAAWAPMAAAGYGRVVFTTSTSALGAADTVAYGMAKMGVLGLARAIAQAGIEHGIRANLVAPQAMTRMMSTGMGRGDDFTPVPEKSPALVAPLVAVLAHEDCPVNGEAFVSGMRRVSRLFVAETAGYVHPGLDLTPETVLEHWDEITDVATAEVVDRTMASSAISGRRFAQVPHAAAVSATVS